MGRRGLSRIRRRTMRRRDLVIWFMCVPHSTAAHGDIGTCKPQWWPAGGAQQCLSVAVAAGVKASIRFGANMMVGTGFRFSTPRFSGTVYTCCTVFPHLVLNLRAALIQQARG